MIGNLGSTELILIFLVIVLFFGAKKIPELAQGLGKGIREFKRSRTCHLMYAPMKCTLWSVKMARENRR